jgi:hypothetical protein
MDLKSLYGPRYFREENLLKVFERKWAGEEDLDLRG